MMRCRPKSARCVHHVAVILKFNDEPAVFAMRECGTDGGRRPMTESAATGTLDGAVMLVDIPERTRASRTGPIFIFDDLPYFGL